MDYGHELEFGVFVTPAAGSAAQVIALAELADRSGLDLVTFQDHPYQARFLDTWTLLSFAAARTSRIRLAPNVLNLPLRPPAVVARAAASLDVLSGGRFELGLGSGAFWDGIEAMGGRRLGPGASVDALEEAIDEIRLLWDASDPEPAHYEGEHYRLAGAARGPAPAHPIGIWVGAYKPRMLALTGRKADGWLPSVPYLAEGQLASGNAAIDEAAVAAGREPAAIRRLLNVPVAAPVEEWVEELTRYALEDGIGTFLAMADDSATIETLAGEVAPAVRERVAAARAGSPPPAPRPVEVPAPAGGSEYERLGVTPTPDDGTRVSDTEPWDESTRPQRPRSGPDVAYSARGKLVGQHLIDVHDVLRRELGELRDILRQVRDGALGAGEARSALNEMALRQNDWTLGAFCSRYCGAVAQHHGLEDEAVFPHLARSDARLQPVIERLADEHLVIHDAIQAVDAALVRHIGAPEDYEPIQRALDFLTDALLSHLSYEEVELVEPLARLGFYPGQL
jgi:alkanesulfonate monooxygenase SsuD/methylene tetrahydromethanopterin reductase-like flavin-dependent oxidoreductase (luciferase family)